MYDLIKTYYLEFVPDLTDGEWSAIREKFTVQHLKRGEFLSRQGEMCNQVSFINKGLIRLFNSIDGKEINTGFVPANEYIAQYDSFLTRQPASGNIDALEDCELINLSYDDMQSLYISHPIFERFGRKIAEMLFIMISSQTTMLLTLNPEERYRSVLQYSPYIIQRVPQYMIASYIGITPEHLSRLRKKMTGK